MANETLSNLSARGPHVPAQPRSSPRRPTARPTSTTEADADHEGFWAEQARDAAHAGPRTSPQALDWSDAPFAKWFVGGELNVAYNCVDRHVEAGNGDRVAIHFEGEPGDTRTITYAELQREVQQGRQRARPTSASARATGSPIYLPMIPEAVVAMLACARHRRPALGGLRRLLRRGPAHPHRRRRGQARHHRRRRLPPRQARRRSSPPSTTRRRQGDSRRVEQVLVVRRTGQDVDVERGPRRLVARRRRRRQPTEHEAQAVRRRAPAVHPLHLRHHREAQGHPAHHRRLPHPGRLHATRSSTCTPRPTSTGAPPTSAGSPATPTSSTARWPTARPR